MGLAFLAEFAEAGANCGGFGFRDGDGRGRRGTGSIWGLSGRR